MGARSVLSFVLLAVVLAAPVSAAGQYVLAERDVARGAAPPAIGPRASSRQDNAHLFIEHDDTFIEPAWVDVAASGNFNDFAAIDSCSVSVGDVGDAYDAHHLLLHPDDENTRRAVVLFTGKILGVQTSSGCLFTGDSIFGNPGLLAYPASAGGLRGLDDGPGDVMHVFRGMQGVSFKLDVRPWMGAGDGSDWDDVRFLVAPAEGPLSPMTELELSCRLTNETATTVDVQMTMNLLSGADVRDATLVILLPPNAMPTTPLPAECTHVPTQDLIRCFDPGPIDAGVTTGVVTITRGLGGQIVAGAVTPNEERDYANNRCTLSFEAMGPDAGMSDTGVPDTGSPLDSAVPPDSAPALDAGGGSDGVGGHDDTSFRGVGGCACRATPMGRDAPALAILLFAALTLLRRKESS